MAHETGDEAARKGEVEFKNGRAYRADPDDEEDREDQTVKDDAEEDAE